MCEQLTVLSERLGRLLVARQQQIAVAESCTGGLIAQSLTDIAGSSAWFERGFITYSNLSKIQMLGVQSKTLDQYGAVSAETAFEMVSGVLQHSEADCAIAITGIAGPTGGTVTKPVGTVFIAWMFKGQTHSCEQLHFNGDRRAVRLQAAAHALQYYVDILMGSD